MSISRTAAIAVASFAVGAGAMVAAPAAALHREGTGEGNQVTRRVFGDDSHGYSLRYVNGTREDFLPLEDELAQCAGITMHVDRVTCRASVMSTFSWLEELEESTHYWHRRMYGQ